MKADRLIAAWLGFSLLGAAAHPAEAPPTPEAAQALALFEATQDLWLERNQRVMTVANRIRIAGLEICAGRRSPVFGLLALTEKELSRWGKDYAAERWGIDERVRVLWVQPGSAAAAGGIRSGDAVLRIDGKRVRTGAGLAARFSRSREKPYRFEVERDGHRLDQQVEYRPGCFSPARVVFDDWINAWVGGGAGGQMAVTTGLLRFVASDDELAVVIGHELGHHVSGRGGYEEAEAHADYVGLYFAARAGYDIGVAPGLWRRWGLASPGSLVVQRRSSHPNSPERALALAETAAEIRKKQAGSQPLLPNENRLAPDEGRAEEMRAAQVEQALEDFVALQLRLAPVASRLLESSSEHCGRHVAPSLRATFAPWRGWEVPDRWYYDVFRDDFDEIGVHVTGVLDGAAAGSLKRGDVVVAVNDRKPETANELLDALEEVGTGAIRLALIRDGEPRVVEVELPIACNHAVVLAPTPVAATGRIPRTYVWIGQGMLALAESDDELAFAIAHELGHRRLGDRRTAYRKNELEADRIAIAMMRRAGYEPRSGIGLLERSALDHPWMIEDCRKERLGVMTRHCRIAERLVAIHTSLDGGG